MSDLPQDPAPKKRVVRSRVATPAGETAPARQIPDPSAGAPTDAQPAASAAPDAPAMPAAPATPAGPRAADPAANAALALAAMSARRGAGSGPAEAAPVRPASRAAALMRRPAAQAAALAIAVAAGWLGAEALATTRPAGPSAPWTETAQALRQGQQDVVRLTGDIKALKVAIESLKESVDRSKADLTARQAQMMERVERGQGDGARLAKLAEQLDRVEASAKEPAVRFAALTDRFDRLERQITTLQSAAARPAAPAPAPTPVPASASAPAPAADGPTQTGTLEAKPAVKEPPRDMPVEGWILHEVYDGVALIEGRNRRLYEVGVGGVIPGVGPVESIERRGKRWVVVTQKGFIGNER